MFSQLQVEVGKRDEKTLSWFCAVGETFWCGKYDCDLCIKIAHESKNTAFFGSRYGVVVPPMWPGVKFQTWHLKSYLSLVPFFSLMIQFPPSSAVFPPSIVLSSR